MRRNLIRLSLAHTIGDVCLAKYYALIQSEMERERNLKRKRKEKEAHHNSTCSVELLIMDTSNQYIHHLIQHVSSFAVTSVYWTISMIAACHVEILLYSEPASLSISQDSIHITRELLQRVLL